MEEQFGYEVLGRFVTARVRISNWDRSTNATAGIERKRGSLEPTAYLFRTPSTGPFQGMRFALRSRRKQCAQRRRVGQNQSCLSWDLPDH